MCSLRYPACNAHAPYCLLCPVPFYNIFLHFLINGARFSKKKVTKTKHVIRFSVQLLSETFLIMRRDERDMIKKTVQRSLCEVPFILFRF